MKKLLFIVTAMLFLVPARAQNIDPESNHMAFKASATFANNIMASDMFAYPFTCFSFVPTAGLYYTNFIWDYLYFRADGDLGIGFVGEDIQPILIGNLGIQIGKLEGLHLFLTASPRMSVMGVGHQMYGDYTIMWLQFGLRIGYNFPISEHSVLFFEAGSAQDFTIYESEALRRRTDPVPERNNVAGWFTIGYKYIIL